MPPPSDETGEGQAEPELAVLQAPFKETGVATPEKKRSEEISNSKRELRIEGAKRSF